MTNEEIRSTPETDAEENKHGNGNAMHAHCHDSSHLSGDFADFARKLERERDEAQERAESKHGLWMAELSRVTELEKQLEAMREAIKDAHYALAYVYNGGAGSCAFPFRIDDDLCSENRFHHVKDALDALKPFLQPLLKP